jgi:hypothetical protein
MAVQAVLFKIMLKAPVTRDPPLGAVAAVAVEIRLTRDSKRMVVVVAAVAGLRKVCLLRRPPVLQSLVQQLLGVWGLAAAGEHLIPVLVPVPLVQGDKSNL